MKVRNLLARISRTTADSTAPTRDDVIGAFRALLEREPESERTIVNHQRFDSVAALYTAIAKSPEFTAKAKASPFFHYNAIIDAHAIIQGHDYPARQPMEGHIVNFLGVAMNAKFMRTEEQLAGVVTEVPIPCNWHADMAEWAAALRAVDLARGTFTVVELGCGWGCWMNNTAVAAKRRGLAVHAIGVEGDAAHVEFAREALATNGIRPDEYTLHLGVAAERPGVALFPKPDRRGEDWGSEPIFNAEPDVFARAKASGEFDEVAIIPLADVIGGRSRIDLVHIDIQGGEADLVRDCLALLSEEVAYLVIGTHSRQIEGRLFDDLIGAGWVLEIERPAILALSAEEGPVTRTDGVQGWRNPKLLPSG